MFLSPHLSKESVGRFLHHATRESQSRHTSTLEKVTLAAYLAKLTKTFRVTNEVARDVNRVITEWEVVCRQILLNSMTVQIGDGNWKCPGSDKEIIIIISDKKIL